MTREAVEQKLRQALPGTRIEPDEPMAKHTTFRVGGPADLMLFARSGQEIAAAREICRQEGFPCMVVGNGSNLVVRDGGIRGLVIQVGDAMNRCKFRSGKVKAEAGLRLITLSRDAIQKGMAGLEFAGGIPGTVGGAVCMNAGAYSGEMKDVLTAVTYLDENNQLIRREVTAEDFGYRTSIFLERGWIVTEAEFLLPFDTDGQARVRYDEFSARRREKQPLSWPSAGSTFKRPEGYYAGALIEAAGLKGLTVGGAQVSELHAGFVINRGGATAGDILSLIALVQEKVFAQSGVRLEPEVRIVGED